MNIKRLQKELRNLTKDPIPNCIAKPSNDNISYWLFTFVGDDDTPYKGGLYMGNISFPVNYPFSPPNIQLMTPNGRFQIHKGICMSITAHHPETWNPALGVRSLLISFISFFYDNNPTLGSIITTYDHKLNLAIDSNEYTKNMPEYKSLFMEEPS